MGKKKHQIRTFAILVNSYLSLNCGLPLFVRAVLDALFYAGSESVAGNIILSGVKYLV